MSSGGPFFCENECICEAFSANSAPRHPGPIFAKSRSRGPVDPLRMHVRSFRRPQAKAHIMQAQIPLDQYEMTQFTVDFPYFGSTNRQKWFGMSNLALPPQL